MIDTTTGSVVFRDRKNDVYDWKRLVAQRLDHVNGTFINMAGIHGGGLRKVTDDGWGLTVVSTRWPAGRLVLLKPESSLFANYTSAKDIIVLGDCGEFRVFGFSWSGRFMVWSDEMDVHIYERDTAAGQTELS